MIQIGIQGAMGSFSEQAAKKFVENQKIKNYSIQYLISSEGVLNAVENEKVDFGIFAMENAQGGVVLESVEALCKYTCKIVEMFHIPIKQNLLVKEGMKIENISEIHSHRQALRQCKEYLVENFWSKPLIQEDDTAEAARRLTEGKIPNSAGVIASEYCASKYGLEILEENIHDLKNNLTLFISIKKSDNK